MPVSAAYRPDPMFAALGEDYAAPVTPAAFENPTLRLRDDRAAKRVGLDTLSDVEWRDMFALFHPLPDNQARPLAMRYHGHQFRVYNPDIGDGRGFLFAQMRDGRGRLLDLGTKGSGQTPFSRFGDGRATLQGVVREALISSALDAFGVPGCAIISVFETSEELDRQDEPSPARGAVMTRLQHSHVRIGTFQRHAAHRRPDLIRGLIEHCVQAYYPDLANVSEGEQPAAFLREALRANAALAARWMAAGFVHGVLNSDNMTITGESFDYGPSRFLPVYAPGFTAAYFDEGGIYAYARQAEATLWNLTRLAGCLSQIADADALSSVLGEFEVCYRRELGEAVCARLGVESEGEAHDLELLQAFYNFLAASHAPWEGTIFDWFGGAPSETRAMDGERARHYHSAAFEAFGDRLRARQMRHDVDLSHPYLAGSEPVSLTIGHIRHVWRRIDEADDWSAFNEARARIADARAAYRLSPEGA